MCLVRLISAKSCLSFAINILRLLHTLNCVSISHQERIVFPELIEGRDAGAVKVLKITEGLTLNLEKSSVLAEEFLLRTYDGPVMQHTYLDGEMLEKDLYHDNRYFSSVMVSQENGLQVEGVLGPMLGIKPSMANTRTWRGSIAHVIYEIPPETEGRNEGVFTHASFNISERQQEQDNADKVVRPEVLVAVDSALARQFKDRLKLLKYVAISMNSVNIRYSTIKHPRVQLRLCALEVLTEREETFLYKVDRYVASGRSIQRIKQYVEYSYKYVEYDAVYFATGLDIARFKGYGWDTTEQGRRSWLCCFMLSRSLTMIFLLPNQVYRCYLRVFAITILFRIKSGPRTSPHASGVVRVIVNTQALQVNVAEVDIEGAGHVRRAEGACDSIVSYARAVVDESSSIRETTPRPYLIWSDDMKGCVAWAVLGWHGVVGS
uniref:Reprolysin n=1 Tax=Rhipicephalus appendiculatus TaxID=34631 RepID=A0A131YYQ1_RHIAP